MAQQPSIPPPSSLPTRLCTKPIRPLPPLGPPADTVTPPTLPSPPRSFPDSSFVLTTHLVPAALPRSTPDVPLPKLPTWSPDKQVWKQEVQKTVDEVTSVRIKQWRGEMDGLRPSQKPLWICLNRYARKDTQDSGQKDITLFFAHANGFHKETWEPCLLRLLEIIRTTPTTYNISEVWTWEAVNHGDSFLVNQNNLCGLYDWRDNSRDILHFLLHYLPDSSSSSTLPTHLPRIPDTIAAERRLHGFLGRTFVGVGHSLGGCSVARAAIEVPKLFTSLILVDPVIRPHPRSEPLLRGKTYRYVVGAVQRQERWSSREEARKRFTATPFFAAWDPAVLDVYLECALCDDPNGGVKLKMPGIYEAVVFTETLATFECWDLLDTLDKAIELRWVIPGKNPPEEAGLREAMVWRRPENSSNVVIPPAGHLIAQETPGLLANEIHQFLQKKYGSVQSSLQAKL